MYSAVILGLILRYLDTCTGHSTGPCTVMVLCVGRRYIWYLRRYHYEGSTVSVVAWLVGNIGRQAVYDSMSKVNEVGVCALGLHSSWKW